MSDDSNIPHVPRPPTRLERALLAQGMYFPPQLKVEIEDALKAIAVEQGYKDSVGLNDFEIRFESQEYQGKILFVINLTGYYNKPGEFTSIVDRIKTYIRDNNIPNIRFEKATDQRMIIECPEFRPLVDTVVEGFINKVAKDPQNKIENVDEIMNAPRTWVDRTQGVGEDTGTGTPPRP